MDRPSSHEVLASLPEISGLDAAKLESATPYEVLRWAFVTFGDGVRIACSFGVEDMVVVHEAVRAARDVGGQQPRVFLLDTGRLHQETYDLLDRARALYKLDFEVFAPATLRVEDLVRRKGANSFYNAIDDRKECCGVRKLEPLSRALVGASAWVTGLRREQSPTRAEVPVIEREPENGRIKINPLAHWSNDQVWAFVREHDVPVHALHAQGFPSIGCAPCTRSVAEGEDVRAGRWWWEAPEHKECGIHSRGAR